jgi:hypothetical protein
MTKNEAKAAGRIGSKKFDELKEHQIAYPKFTVRIVANPKRKSQFTGLDYDFMEKYIKQCDKENKDEILKEFNILRGKSTNDSTAKDKENDPSDTAKVEDKENKVSIPVKAEKASYLEVKKWFLDKFPEIKKFKEDQQEKIKAILNAA